MSDMITGKAAALADILTLVDAGSDLFQLDDVLRVEVSSEADLNKTASEHGEEYMRGYQAMAHVGIAKIAELCGECEVQDPVAAASEFLEELIKEAEEKGWLQSGVDKLKDYKARAQAHMDAGRNLTYTGEGQGSIQGRLSSAKDRLSNALSEGGASALQMGSRIARGGPNAGFVRRNAVPLAAGAGLLAVGARAAMNRNQDGKKGKDARAEFAGATHQDVAAAFELLRSQGYNVGG